MCAKKTGSIEDLAVLGIDIGKDMFHLVGFDRSGQLVMRKHIKRLALTATFEQLPRCIVGMEACLSAHFVSRTLRSMGFEPRIIPAIYVKPFNKGQKNDYNDAEAIAEAALRPNLRTVSEKDQDELDLQALHRVRARLVSRRTATINQIRAFLIEQGITVRSGLRALKNSFETILEQRRDEISPRMRGILIGLYGDWHWLDKRIEDVSGEIEEISRSEENCANIMTIPGIGPMISTAMVAAVGKGAHTVAFRWKDYRIKSGDRQKVMRLATPEFIRRFLIHVLPDGFHRIRHYGQLASSARKANITKIRALLCVQQPDRVATPEPKTEIAPLTLREPCPCCGEPMRIIEIFRRGQIPMSRAPPREQAA